MYVIGCRVLISSNPYLLSREGGYPKAGNMKDKPQGARHALARNLRLRSRKKARPSRYVKLCVLGAPGVGKSTLLDEYLKGRADGRRAIYTPDSIKRSVVALMAKTHGSVWQRFLCWAMINVPARRMADLSIAYGFRQCAKREYRRGLRGYGEMLDLAWRGFELKIRPTANRIAVTSFLHRIAQEEILIDSARLPETVIFDDSLWQCIYGARETIGPMADRAAFVARLPRPDGVIYCAHDLETVCERIFERAQNGRLNTVHQGLSREEIRQMAKDDLDNARFKADILRESGVPVCELDLSEPRAALLARLDEFVRTFE